MPQVTAKPSGRMRLENEDIAFDNGIRLRIKGIFWAEALINSEKINVHISQLAVSHRIRAEPG